MKKIILILVIFCSINGYSQKIEKDYIDEFTKNHIVETEWNSFFNGMSSIVKYKIKKIDDNYFMLLKIIVFNKPIYFSNEQPLMFKTANGSICSIKTMDFGTPCLGCGSTGFVGSKAIGTQANYIITKEQLECIKNDFVDKIRIYTTGGYIEYELKGNRKDDFKTNLNLF